ncbi:hypothetical protein D3C87_2115800 [compost metagenome]
MIAGNGKSLQDLRADYLASLGEADADVVDEVSDDIDEPELDDSGSEDDAA